MNSTRAVLIAFSLALCVMACEDESQQIAQQTAAAEALKARFNEPVGFKMPAGEGVPGYTIILAFSRGATVESLGNSVITVLNGAVRSCPDFVRAGQLGRDSKLTFALSDGRVTAPDTPGTDPGTACVAKAIDGAELPLPPGMTVEVMSRFVFDGGAASKTAAPPAPAAKPDTTP